MKARRRRDLARNKDAEMANAFVHRIDDRLAIGDDFIHVVVQIEQPVLRLLRRP